MKSLKAKHYIEETLEIKYSRNNKINLNIEHIFDYYRKTTKLY